MTVGELKAMLDKYPSEMQVIHDRFSDYEDIDEDMFTVVEAVFKGGKVRTSREAYYMRSHPTMSDENKCKSEMCLHLDGN